MSDKEASVQSHRYYMEQALKLAEKQLGRTAPNPAVGCVIVKEHRIIGQAATAHGGRPHAEALALKQAGARARHATVYTTLEPCCHTGQTPPCTEALIRHDVARVVIVLVLTKLELIVI